MSSATYHDPHGIGSLSKTVIAIAILCLVENGSLNLDDKVYTRVLTNLPAQRIGLEELACRLIRSGKWQGGTFTGAPTGRLSALCAASTRSTEANSGTEIPVWAINLVAAIPRQD